MRYEDYYELSEKMGWRATDLEWDDLRRHQDAGLIGDFERKALLGTAVIEHGVPHYAEVKPLAAYRDRLPRNDHLETDTSNGTGPSDLVVEDLVVGVGGVRKQS